MPPECYLVLGDHRSMSNDSRDFGPVNQSYIYGKAVFGYWPMDKLGTVAVGRSVAGAASDVLGSFRVANLLLCAESFPRKDRFVGEDKSI